MLPIANVTGYLRCPHNPAGRIADRRHRESDIDDLSVLSAPASLVMFHAEPLFYLGKDFRHFIQTIRCSQDRDGLPHDFSGSVPKNTLSAVVPTGDDPA